jgi:quinoprotein relay system zinc metallohydrolase 2
MVKMVSGAGSAGDAASSNGCAATLAAASRIAFCGVLALLCTRAFAAQELTVTELAPGVFVHVGQHAGATPENQGAIANVGFVIGARCVAVIDSGGSFGEGVALRTAISARTALPVCYVINTHVHPDHVYGNAAFAADRPHVVGHRNLAAAMRARQGYYVGYLERTIGAAEAAQSVAVPPDMAVEATQSIDLGGRSLKLQAWPTAHTDNDLTVLDEQSGTFWAGDLLFTERIPVIDGKLTGWLGVMDQLQQIPVTRVVPGHGTPGTGWTAMLGPQRRYLLAVRDGVRAALKAHRTITQATAEVGMEERGKWALFDAFHAHNVTATFTELEWED